MFTCRVVMIFILLSTNIFAFSLSTCMGCHGKKFEKRAQGKSRVVKDMTKEEIVKRLHYFKTSDSIMKSYASRLSDKEISQIANVFGK